jgi:hypothetical protein
MRPGMRSGACGGNRRVKISPAFANGDNTQNRRKEPLEIFDLCQIQYRFLDVALPCHKWP